MQTYWYEKKKGREREGNQEDAKGQEFNLERLLKSLYQQEDAYQHSYGGYIIVELQVNLFSYF